MSTVFDTASVAPGERFEGWQEAAARCFFPMAIRPRAIGPFAGRLVGHELPSIDIFRVAAAPNDCLRTPGGDRRARPRAAAAPRPAHAAAARWSRTTGRDVLTAGSMTTLDSSRPWALRAVEPFELLVRRRAEGAAAPVRDVLAAGTARTIPADAPWPASPCRSR